MKYIFQTVLTFYLLLTFQTSFGKNLEMVLDSSSCRYSINEKGNLISFAKSYGINYALFDPYKRIEYIQELLEYRKVNIRSSFLPKLKFNKESNFQNYDFNISVSLEAIIIINALIVNANPYSNEYEKIFRGFKVFDNISKKWDHESDAIIEKLFDWYQKNYLFLILKPQLEKKDFVIPDLEWN